MNIEQIIKEFDELFNAEWIFAGLDYPKERDEEGYQWFKDKVKDFLRTKLSKIYEKGLLDQLNVDKQYYDTKLQQQKEDLTKSNLIDFHDWCMVFRQDLIEKIEKEIEKLYCTADHLGYHDKNCEGLPCEKSTLEKAISLIKQI